MIRPIFPADFDSDSPELRENFVRNSSPTVCEFATGHATNRCSTPFRLKLVVFTVHSVELTNSIYFDQVLYKNTSFSVFRESFASHELVKSIGTRSAINYRVFFGRKIVQCSAVQGCNLVTTTKKVVSKYSIHFTIPFPSKIRCYDLIGSVSTPFFSPFARAK